MLQSIKTGINATFKTQKKTIQHNVNKTMLRKILLIITLQTKEKKKDQKPLLP